MDEIYIKKTLNGDTAAFKYFVCAYKDFAFSLSYSILKNKYLAEECVQLAFIKAFENLKAFRGNSSFRTWLGRIVINKSLRQAERQRKEPAPVEEISETEISYVEDSLGNLYEKERRKYITLVFEMLSPQASLALDLFYLKENSIAEIAELTGWSISKIKMTLTRGRKSFYNKLNQLLKTEVKELR